VNATAPASGPMIQIKNVSKWYGTFQVLTDCTTDVKKGEVVVVCGPSGSGKSTLIKTVNALEPFQKGEILVDGVAVGDRKTNLAKLRSRIGMVFQNFELFPHMRIVDNLTIGVSGMSTTNGANGWNFGNWRIDTNNGITEFWVGGRLNVNAQQRAGVYTGVMMIQIQFN